MLIGINRKNLRIARALGFTCIAAAFAAMGIDYYKGDSKMLPLIMVSIGAVLLLTVVITNVFADRSECYWCGALVPSVYTDIVKGLEAKSKICVVCSRRARRYPIGSRSIPEPTPCSVCKQGSYSTWIKNTRDGTAYCIDCVRTIHLASVDFSKYVRSSGLEVDKKSLDSWLSQPLESTADWPRSWWPFVIAAFMLAVVMTYVASR